MDAKEEKRKRARERYAHMPDEEKQKLLKKRREAYQENKTKKYADQDQQQKTQKCAQERKRYANLQPEEKKARIKQVAASRDFRRSTPSKDSNAMVNPAYIATEEEVCTSALNEKQRKPVTPGERQTWLNRRNKEFSVKQRKTHSLSSQENTSVINSSNDDIEPIKHPEVMINGNTFIYKTRTFQKEYYSF
jgi:hypothetical protein